MDSAQKDTKTVSRWPAVVIALLCTLAISRGVSAYDDDPTRRGEATIALASKNAKAMILARERYRFAHWFASEMGVWPISHMVGDYQDSVLFPLGRSDRAYVLLFPGYGIGDPVDRVLCYQRKGDGYSLVYRVTLKDKARPAKPGAGYTSLLYSLAQDVQGSRFAKSDLATKRDYVQYDHEAPVDTLEVSLRSKYSVNGTVEESYFLAVDPVTKGKLREGKTHGKILDITNGEQEFYQKYGLPVTCEELKL